VTRRRAIVGAAAGLAVVLSLAPFLWALLTSFKSAGEITLRPPDVWPSWSLGFYRAVFVRHDFLRYALNSAIVASCTALLSVVLGALAAWPLARARFRGRNAALFTILAAAMFPQIAIAGVLYRMLSAAHLLNTYAGLVLPYTALTLPLSVWILFGFFRDLPPELEEAALVDGCGPVGALARIVAPLAAPAVFTAGILVFINAWNEFFLALLITTNPAVQTLPVGIAKFPGEYQVPWGELCAAAVVATLPLVVLVLVLEKRIVSGLTAGAVK